MSAVKAGRELDALIAEKVMGMARPPWTPTHAEVGRAYVSGAGPKWRLWPWTINYWGTDKPVAWEPLRFSTDIGAAWKVVEKMRAAGFVASVSDMPGESIVRAVARFATTPLMPTHDEYDACADTVPLAICKAAIQAFVTESVTKPAEAAE